MPFKARCESDELLILRSLNNRMKLTADQNRQYLNLEKGYAGEVQFDLLTEKLQSQCYILNDLLLKVNNTKFQLDSSIIFQDTLYLFEVKNYEGDYFIDEDGTFKTISKKEINDPLDQLKRSKSLLRQLFQSLGFNIPIEGYVVFVNQEFTLYQASLNTPIIFPSQLKRTMEKLNARPSTLNHWHKKLADKLVSLHQVESPNSRLPTYDYGHLKNGLTCKDCHSFSMVVSGWKVVCGDCGSEEKVEGAVLRSVKEFQLLFPDMKVTTNVIHDWCKVIDSKKRISRILDKHFTLVGVGQWSFYERKDD